MELYANGVLVDAKPNWTKNSKNVWVYTFAKLPSVDENGETITYTVKEVPVEYYETTIEGTTITNSLIPMTPTEYTEITGVKKWNDNGNSSGKRPSSITVHLLRDGVEIDSRVVTAATEWKYSFGNLPLDTGYGTRYVYTIREDAVPGYFCRVEGMDLLNTLLPTEGPGPHPEGYEDTPPTTTTRHSASKGPGFSGMKEEEFEELMEMLGYGTPLWGMLGTGDETPAYPFVFGGIGTLILAMLLITRRKRNRA